MLAQELRRLEARAEGRGEIFGDAEADVEADQIGEAQRSHRMVVAELHRAIDVLGGGDAFFEHADRLEADGHAEARRGEAGRVADDDRRLPHLLRDLAHLARSSSDVRSPRTISISFITCGGLKKWSPTKRSRRSTLPRAW